MTWRRLLLPLAVSAALLVAAGGFLAAVSVGGEDDDSKTRQEMPLREREREPQIDRLPPDQAFPVPLPRHQAFVGIALDEDGDQVLVRRVVRGGPAFDAGIEESDVIEAIGDTPVHDRRDLVDIVRESERGNVLTFHVRRDGEQHAIEVRVGQRPGPPGLGRERLEPLLPDGELFDVFTPFPFREFLGEAYVHQLVEGELIFFNDEGERESLRLVAGAIDEASEERVVVERNGGGRQEFTIMDDTRIVRGLRRARAGDLQQGDRVLVVARDDGREASAILAFPALEEEPDG